MNMTSWRRYLAVAVLVFALILGTGLLYSQRANAPVQPPRGNSQEFSQMDMYQTSEPADENLNRELSSETDLEALEQDLQNTVILDEDFSDL